VRLVLEIVQGTRFHQTRLAFARAFASGLDFPVPAKAPPAVGPKAARRMKRFFGAKLVRPLAAEVRMADRQH